MRLFLVSVLSLISGLLLHGAPSGDDLVVCDFEDRRQTALFEVNAGTTRLVSEGVVRGERALEITFDSKGRYGAAYMTTGRMPRDWSSFDALVLHVTNPGATPIRATLLIADQAWADSGRSYWNRHNSGTMLVPGRTRWVIPVQGLYRGEAGSRNRDIKRNIDADAIVRLDFGFGRPGSTGRVIVDAVALTRSGRPSGVHCFDFGPSNQAVMPGWTGIDHATKYTSERGFGWGPAGGTPWQGAARDTTFGPPLIRDFCEAGGYRFRVDVPPGHYRITVFYENSGYWGGEQAQHAHRSITIDGAEAWTESRPEAEGHALYRFEQLEPIGVDIWDTYMATELARPVTFPAESSREGLTIRFRADRTWGSKISGLVVQAEDDVRGGEWVKEQLADLAREFRMTAVCLDPEVAASAIPPAWEGRPLAWPIRIDDELTPGTQPPAGIPAPSELVISAVAVRGEQELLCAAIRPQRDLGTVPVRATALVNAKGQRLSSEVAVIWYGTSRTFNTIAYRTRPHTLRPAQTVALPADLTRGITVRVRVPRRAVAGRYRGQLKVGNVLDVPLEVVVLPVSVDRETSFLMGFFGLMPPGLIPAEKKWDVLEQTLALLREYGMNAVSGGPSWRLTGWRDGQPQVDFGEMDRFFSLLRNHGFIRPLNGYGGARFGGLHTRYEKGRDGAKVERES
ncbi:MAG: hypothetical protein HON70_26930, partial [Lentisphaerae bacterium]|nr:hypothetical protein [Lentisphaerota bacterium]